MGKEFLREMTGLFEKDLNTLIDNISQIPEKHLWDKPEGLPNSCGVLAQHLAGNLKTFVGYHICNVPYNRDRDAEFRPSNKTNSDLIKELEQARDIIVQNLPNFDTDKLDKPFAGKFPRPANNRDMLILMYGHLNYHLGQLNYLRRMF